MVDVNWFMTNVIISAYNQVRSLFAQVIDPNQEILQKLHLEVLADVSGRTAGNINVHYGDVTEVCSYHTSLAVIFGISHTYYYAVGFDTREDGYPRVPFLFRRVDITAVA